LKLLNRIIKRPSTSSLKSDYQYSVCIEPSANCSIHSWF